MKERKYKEDWVNETRFDEKAGNEKRVPVYRGSWFTLPAGEEKRKLLLLSVCAWTGFLALVLLYFRLNFPGSRIMYIFLPAALSLFPCLYWAMGIRNLFRAPQQMTRVQMETGAGRILRSAAGCAILSCAALTGEAIYLFSGGNAAREWPGLLMLLAAGILALGVTQVFRNVHRQLSEKRRDDP